MQSIQSFLFLVALLGAVCGHSICPSNHGFLTLDSAETMAQKFLERMTRSIESQDIAVIRGLFEPRFVFTGCKGVYNKEKFVGILSPNTTGANSIIFTLKSAKDNGPFIKFTASVTGFGASAVESVFVLNKVDQQLESVVIPTCQKSHFHGFVAQDSAQEMVHKFLGRIVRSVESQDVSMISDLFQPGFVFKGCKGEYNKEKVIGILSTLRDGTEFSMTLKSVQDWEGSIKYTVLVSGFSTSPIEANFVLDKIDQQLESGEIPKCQKSRFLGFNDEEPLIGRSLASDPTPIMQYAWDQRILPIFVSGDASRIGTLFHENFTFKGCHGTYSKTDAINKIVSLSAEVIFSFKLVSAKWNDRQIITCIISVWVPMMERTQAEFVYSPEMRLLESGSILQCPPKGFMDFY